MYADDSERPAKIERKRQREKQRRDDITRAFQELSRALVIVDPQDTADAHSKTKRRRSSSIDGGENRVDLINRTIGVLTRLHAENQQIKRQLSQFQPQNSAIMPPSGQAYAMVPSHPQQPLESRPQSHVQVPYPVPQPAPLYNTTQPPSSTMMIASAQFPATSLQGGHQSWMQPISANSGQQAGSYMPQNPYNQQPAPPTETWRL